MPTTIFWEFFIPVCHAKRSKMLHTFLPESRNSAYAGVEDRTDVEYLFAKPETRDKSFTSLAARSDGKVMARVELSWLSANRWRMDAAVDYVLIDKPFP